MPDLVVFFDLVQSLGNAAWSAIWVPVCVWTAVVLAATGALRVAPHALPPVSTYRFQQALLGALPAGILGAVLIDIPGRGSLPTNLPISGLPGTSLPGVTVMPDGYALTWTHGIGVLTLFAAGTAIFATVRLFQQVRKTRSLSRSIVRSASTPAASTPPLLSSRDSLRRHVEQLRQRLCVRRPARLIVSSVTDAPMLVPGLSPMIVLPEWMVAGTPCSMIREERIEDKETGGEQIEMSLAHELIHLRRYDDWAALAERWVAALATIHPLVHMLVRDIRLNRERACDAAVLRTLRCQRGSYARLLTRVAQQSSPAPAIALSESMSSLQQRLQTMTQSPRISNSTMVRFLTGGVFALLIVGMTACADSPSATTTDATSSAASSAEATNTDKTEYQRPSLIGGLSSVTQKVQYPASAAQQGIEGRVFVQFTVTEDGAVTDANVARGVSPELDAEALRVVKTLSFEPATQSGEAVSAEMTFPISFKLSSDDAR